MMTMVENSDDTSSNPLKDGTWPVTVEIRKGRQRGNQFPRINLK